MFQNREYFSWPINNLKVTKTRQIGETKSAGYQFGVRRTVNVSSDKVWEFLFEENGLNIWLGKPKSELEINKSFETEDGIIGRITTFVAFSHFRLKWKPSHWDNNSTLQIRVIENKNRSTIVIHHELLLDSHQRDEVKEHWTSIIENLKSELEATK